MFVSQGHAGPAPLAAVFARRTAGAGRTPAPRRRFRMTGRLVSRPLPPVLRRTDILTGPAPLTSGFARQGQAGLATLADGFARQGRPLPQRLFGDAVFHWARSSHLPHVCLMLVVFVHLFVCVVAWL